MNVAYFMYLYNLFLSVTSSYSNLHQSLNTLNIDTLVSLDKFI